MAARLEDMGSGSGRGGDGKSIFQKAAKGLVVAGSGQVQLAWGGGPGSVPIQQVLFTISEGPDKAEPMCVTLLPPTPTTGSNPAYYGFEPYPLLNCFAIIQWGTQQSPAQAEIDFAQGTVFPVYGGYLNCIAMNLATAPYEGAPPPSVQAFAAPGNFSQGNARRTKPITLDGVIISAANPLVPGASSDLTPIAPFLTRLTVAVSPQLASLSATPLPFGVSFYDSGQNLIGSYVLTTATPVVSEVPGDAKFVQLTDLSASISITSARYIFSIGL